ncbi:MAG: molybdopterin-dependent oxidoreductase [SAR324 cluster bacterium]|nr:molybdopterin-dependent oxidoreductase [SAR324 cluster bacterium]MBL7035721.1 molybdopterin-dependent oxidoreductase [SAR324 cluster bacterium]
MLSNDDVEIKPSVCTLDCPDTCSLSVKTDGLNVVEVRGSKANPYTAGVICNKVMRAYPDYLHGANRLTHPLKRVGARGGSQFERISWDDALDLVHAGFSSAIKKYGPQTVMPLNYAGPHGELAGGSMDRRFFHQLGASMLSRGHFCGLVRGSAYTSLYGTAPGMPPEQLQHSDLIIIWGNNVTVSNLHLSRVIKKARNDHGAKLIVIDPKRTRIAEQADLHIQIKPGTDVVLALALAAELERCGSHDMLFVKKWVDGYDSYMENARLHTSEKVEKICGVNRETFELFADWYAAAKTVGVSVGNGLERGQSGGSGIRAAMSLQVLTGNHGRMGAGVFAKPGNSFPKSTARLQRPDLVPEGTRTINIVNTSEVLLDKSMDPPIKAVFIYNHNPVLTHPDQNRMRQALEQEDLFIVGADIVMTDSMAYCDVVLPASSHFEFSDIYGAYGHHYLQRAEQVIACVGESLPNTEIFRRLAGRFGFDDPIFKETDAELMDAAFTENDSRLGETRPSEFPLDQALAMTTMDGAELILCDTVLPGTSSGRIELFSQDLEKRFGYGLPRYEPVERKYPLSIISPSSSKRTNTTFGGCTLSDGQEEVEINPQDAEMRGVSEGDTLRIHNERGETLLTARITDAVMPGVLYTPKGTWLSASKTGQTVNALLNADLRTDIEDGACYNETFCEVSSI